MHRITILSKPVRKRSRAGRLLPGVSCASFGKRTEKSFKLVAKTLVAAISCTAATSSAVNPSQALEIIVEGRPGASIIIPDQPLPVVNFAAGELQYHIEQATSVKLPIIAESEMATAATGDFIFLGSTRAAADAGLRSAELTPNEFIIKLVNRNLFMLGDDSPGRPAGVLHNNRTRVGTMFAVYEFLEKHLEVRWLWPGELGEVIPPRDSIVVETWDQQDKPAFVHARLRDGFGPVVGGRAWGATDAGWSSPEARVDFFSEQGKWMRRNRFALGENMDIRHSFTNWWRDYGESHPQYFNLLPDGTRRPCPVRHSPPTFISMCVSNPELIQKVVEERLPQMTPEMPWLDISENDTPGLCTCDDCLAWDVPDPELGDDWGRRLELARQAFNNGDRNWHVKLGSMSDRYARFMLAVQQQAEEIVPKARVANHAYINYSAPPLATMLNERVLFAIVPRGGFPFPAADRQQTVAEWDGWAKTGTSLMLRPNWTLEGNAMPMIWAREIGEMFRHFAHRGMIATDFDSLTGQYATQGPNLYMLARLHSNPGLTVDQVLDEYYSAFGPAAAEVRNYFEYWSELRETVEESPTNLHWTRVSGWDQVFTPEVLARGREWLELAAARVPGENIFADRVDYLEKGLRHVELILAAETAYEQYRQGANLRPFQEAVRELEHYRSLIEGKMIANLSFLHWSENMTWDLRDLVARQEIGERLPDPWKFMWDPEDQGKDLGWSADDFDDDDWYEIGTDGPWGAQPPGRKWREEHGENYLGLAWYRTEFKLEADPARPRIQLIFGAVDEACTVWVNGEKILERPYPYQGNRDSWMESFTIEISDVIRYDRLNTIAVRVEAKVGQGGIWRRAWVLQSEPTQ